MIVFSDGHWASIRIAGEGVREDLPEEPTDEQRLEAWRPVRASAGSYTLQGNELTATTLISKNPNAMNSQNTFTSKVEVDGDTMVRTFTNEENGNTWTVTAVRLD